MPPRDSSLEESYRRCAQLARRANSNFHLSFWTLPRAKRRAMTAFYAFARHTDDLGDEPGSPEEKEQRLCEWQTTLDAALAGDVAHPWLGAVADTVRRYSIPSQLLNELIEGVAMDVRPAGFATFADLRRYCYHVAGTVGLACLHIWEFTGEIAREPAEKCGVAFQLTNILRDLGEDLRAGRIYLPAEDFSRFDLRAEDLVGRATMAEASGGSRSATSQTIAEPMTTATNERFLEFVRFQIHRAEQFYRDGAATAEFLSSDGRRMFRMMFNTYHRLLGEILRQPRDILRRRLRLSVPRKLTLAGLSFVPGCFPPRWLDLCEPQGAGRGLNRE